MTLQTASLVAIRLSRSLSASRGSGGSSHGALDLWLFFARYYHRDCAIEGAFRQEASGRV
jgi:hypothetical protein